MTSIKSSSFVRRSSLCPPQEQADSPNASMVDGSSVQKSLTRHQRQRDQETVTAQEQKNQLDQQRLSLLTAEKFVEHCHTSSSLDDSNNVVHQFYQARPKKTEQSKK